MSLRASEISTGCVVPLGERTKADLTLNGDLKSSPVLHPLSESEPCVIGWERSGKAFPLSTTSPHPTPQKGQTVVIN